MEVTSICLIWCFILSCDACVNFMHMEQDMEIELDIEPACETHINLSPGLLAQVTCNSVSGDYNRESCSDKALTITADDSENDSFCISKSNAGLMSSIKKIYENKQNLRFKVGYAKRDITASLSSCSISTRRPMNRTNQRSLFSALLTMLVVPGGADFFNETLDCGKVKVIPSEKRIFGGQEAIEHNYNFMVVIIKEDFTGKQEPVKNTVMCQYHF